MAARSNRRLMVWLAALGAAGVGALACTPLGGWLYSDPTFALTGVSTRFRGMPADTLQFVLTGCNLNDFNVEGLTIEGRLEVAGAAVGDAWVDRDFTMPMRDSVDVPVPLVMPRGEAPPVHAKGSGPETAEYELNGRIEVNTPIGIRRVMLRQAGQVRFDSAGILSGWTVRNARPCKPGQSILPGQSPSRTVTLDTMFRPEPPPMPQGQPGRDF